MSEKNINIFFFIVLGFFRPLNPSFFFSFSKFTSYFAFTDVCLNTNMNFTSTATVSSGTLTHAWDFDDASTSPAARREHGAVEMQGAGYGCRG
jgi:hypothetical protein